MTSFETTFHKSVSNILEFLSAIPQILPSLILIRRLNFKWWSRSHIQSKYWFYKFEGNWRGWKCNGLVQSLCPWSFSYVETCSAGGGPSLVSPSPLQLTLRLLSVTYGRPDNSHSPLSGCFCLDTRGHLQLNTSQPHSASLSLFPANLCFGLSSTCWTARRLLGADRRATVAAWCPSWPHTKSGSSLWGVALGPLPPCFLQCGLVSHVLFVFFS